VNYNTIISHVNNHFNDFTPTNGIDAATNRQRGIRIEMVVVPTAQAQNACIERDQSLRLIARITAPSNGMCW